MNVAAVRRDLLLEGIGVAGEAEPTSIWIADGRIAAIGVGADVAADAPAGTRHFDGAGLIAAPGFIDLQVNGAAGHDLTAEPESIWAVGEALPKYGVTSFLATIVSAPLEVVERARQVFLAGPPAGYPGATPLGLHVEGPFLAPGRSGAHDPAALRTPESVEEALLAGWSREGGVRIVTLAPELPGAIELIFELVDRGVVVSAGHSNATWDQARAGFDAGIRGVTHLFNAMRPLDHREPGLAAAALADPRVTVWLIADGIHVHPGMVDLVRRIVGPDRLVLVTDAIAALGMGPGRYPLGALEVVLDGGSARLEDGVLAGSILTLDGAARNLVAFTGCSIDEAIAAVTGVPARLLGLDAERGPVREGASANLTVLTPDLRVVATIVDGRVAYQAAGEADGRWA